ncbi:MAG: helix-turn-helix transcriptional regulator [Gemmatimonadaceae bacterium]|nr:helix-turn-helix transcriptional regulator [Gemmatimonadaceae bacterium]
MSPPRHRSTTDDALIVRSLALRLPPGHRIDAHDHAWLQVVYAESGVMTVSADDHQWVVPPHRCLLLPPRVPHAVSIVSTTAMRTLYLRHSLARGLADAIRVMDVSPLLRELILECVQLGALDRRTAQDRALATVLLARLREAPTLGVGLPLPADPRARRVAEFVLADPGASLPLADLAARAAASARTIERLFTDETGLSFGRWRQQARLQHALRRLAEGDPVTTVSLACGYDSPSAFSAMFRRALGANPRDYLSAPRAAAVPRPATRARSPRSHPR